jgi:hypothetical protein
VTVNLFERKRKAKKANETQVNLRGSTRAFAKSLFLFRRSCRNFNPRVINNHGACLNGVARAGFGSDKNA